MKRLLAISVTLLVLATAFPASGAARPVLLVGNSRNVMGTDVRITLVNRGDSPLTFENPWVVRDSKGQPHGRFYWAEESERTIAPGESRTWRWDGTPNSCGSDGACTDVGGMSGADRYTATVKTSAGEVRASFLMGRYFTLGFRCGESDCDYDPFAVFVARHGAMRTMMHEARSSEPTQIVSGIVKGAKPYNSNWSYTMGPRTIVLGEVFTEVCDSNPRYVENHRRAWRGERWCPWSSYVKKIGRP